MSFIVAGKKVGLNLTKYVEDLCNKIASTI